MPSIFYSRDDVVRKLRPFLTEYKAQEKVIKRLNRRLWSANNEHRLLLLLGGGDAYRLMSTVTRDLNSASMRFTSTLSRVAAFEMVVSKAWDNRILLTTDDIQFLDRLSPSMVLEYRAALRRDIQTMKWEVDTERHYQRSRAEYETAKEPGVITLDREMTKEQRAAYIKAAAAAAAAGADLDKLNAQPVAWPVPTAPWPAWFAIALLFVVFLGWLASGG